MPDNDNNFEIRRMLTLSTAHITQDTARAIEDEPDANALGLSVYEKAGGGESFGWFIYLDTEHAEGYDPALLAAGRIPADLAGCIDMARRLGCEILCFDCDGREQPELPVYEWTDGS